MASSIPNNWLDFRQLRCVRRARIGPASSFQRNGNYALIFGAHKQLTGSWQQRRDQDSRSQRAEKCPPSKTAHAEHGSDVNFIACHRDGLDLAIGHSLFFAERVGCPGVPVDTPDSAFPPTGRILFPRAGDIQMTQGRMKSCDFPSVVKQDTALPGSNQQMPGGGRQDRCDGARTRVLGKDLPEGAAVEE